MQALSRRLQRQPSDMKSAQGPADWPDPDQPGDTRPMSRGRAASAASGLGLDAGPPDIPPPGAGSSVSSAVGAGEIQPHAPLHQRKASIGSAEARQVTRQAARKAARKAAHKGGQAGAAVPALAEEPRRSLCTRTSRWLCVAVGLLGLTWIAGYTSGGNRSAGYSGAGLGGEFNPATEPGSVDTPGEPWWESTPLSGRLTAQLAALAREEETGGTKLLSKAMETILVEDEAIPVVKGLAGILLSPDKAGMALWRVDRRVDAFRASRYWRENDPTTHFLIAMLELMGNRHIQESQLRHLMRIWSWRYGDLRGSPKEEISDPLSATLSASIVGTTAYLLGGPAMSDGHLRILFDTACRQPEGTPPVRSKDQVLSRHGASVAHALLYLTQSLSEPLSKGRQGRSGRLDEAQLRRCLRLLMEDSALEPRWKNAILDGFDSLEGIAQRQSWLPPGRLQQVIVGVLREQVTGVSSEPG